MKSSKLVGAIIALSYFLSTPYANSATITNLYDLDIGGTLYDVTFHTGNGDTFNALWDFGNDNVFGPDGSTFSTAPTFWGDASGALAATNAIMGALGSGDTSGVVNYSDGFLVPYARVDTDTVRAYEDASYYDLSTDVAGIFDAGDYVSPHSYDRPWASFSASAVPVPAAAWLFASGLLGLVAVKRRR